MHAAEALDDRRDCEVLSTAVGDCAPKAEGGLALRCDFPERQMLIQADPQAFYLTDHYNDWLMVLVNLTEVRWTAMPMLIEAPWRLVAPASSSPTTMRHRADLAWHVARIANASSARRPISGNRREAAWQCAEPVQSKRLAPMGRAPLEAHTAARQLTAFRDEALQLCVGFTVDRRDMDAYAQSITVPAENFGQSCTGLDDAVEQQVHPIRAVRATRLHCRERPWMLTVSPRLRSARAAEIAAP